jgi:AcrR family transcriptional regulator
VPEISEKQSVRDEILDATNRLLVRFGYRKMTIEDIASEVGIGKGTVYLHFTSKADVVLSTIDRLVQRLLDRLEEIARGPGSPVEKLEKMLMTRIMFRFDHRHHDSKSMDELLAVLRPEFLLRREGYFEAEARALAKVLEEGRAAGDLGFDEALPTAHTLILATNSLLPYSLSPDELGKRKDVEQKASRLSRLAVGGVLPRPAGAADSQL